MNQRFRVFVRVMVIFGCSLFIGACGQKGDLFLPTDPNPALNDGSTPDCNPCTANTPEQQSPQQQEANTQ